MIWKILTVILAVSVAVLIAVLVKIRAQLRDINEQLDFLCEKDTNMLLLTDTNMADIGRLKERINRFLEQWHRQREAAAKKEQMISDTYTNLSHDIRTPLTSLDGYFQLLRDLLFLLNFIFILKQRKFILRSNPSHQTLR